MRNHTHIETPRHTQSTKTLRWISWLGPLMLCGPMACYAGAGRIPASAITVAELQTTHTVRYIGDYDWSMSRDDLCESGWMRRVTGNVYIQDAGDLLELSCLAEIEGDLKIWFNPALTSLEGLDSLSNIGGDVYISFNPALTSLEGLDSLSNIGGNIYIEGSSALTSLEGLDSLSNIGGDVYISSNDQLIDLAGISSLTAIAGTLEITANPALSSVAELHTVQVSGGIQIYNNPALTSLMGRPTRAGGYPGGAGVGFVAPECAGASIISCRGSTASL